MSEKISRFLDNDLSHDETLLLLDTIKEQPELKAKLKRYAAISYAMKTDDFLWISNDFSARIHQAIKQTSLNESSHQSTDGYPLQ
jgi:sigma-E factor negative regulatory protein RseA